MRFLQGMSSILKWFGLSLFWLVMVFSRPDIVFGGSCSKAEALWALVPFAVNRRDCEIGFYFATPFLEFAEDGAPSWGWAWLETSWHVALWIACTIGSVWIIRIFHRKWGSRLQDR
jgi:hypothetical protein